MHVYAHINTYLHTYLTHTGIWAIFDVLEESIATLDGIRAHEQETLKEKQLREQEALEVPEDEGGRERTAREQRDLLRARWVIYVMFLESLPFSIWFERDWTLSASS